jgi:hypothetical protein
MSKSPSAHKLCCRVPYLALSNNVMHPTAKGVIFIRKTRVLVASCARRVMPGVRRLVERYIYEILSSL